MLKLQNVYKTFEDRTVLADVNLSVPQGVTHALIGSSGSGKTTLLRITLGLIPFETGYVKINDQPLSSFSPVEWADRIGYVPQDGGLFPHIIGSHNVVADRRNCAAGGSRRIADRVEELRKLVDLEPSLLQRFPHEMSGGQKQRVAIMRAAMMDPAVMLLDEPMAALDPLIRRSLQQELKSIFQRLGKTVLIVTHDLGEAVFLAEQNHAAARGPGAAERHLSRPAARIPADPFVTQFINAQRTLPDAARSRDEEHGASRRWCCRPCCRAAALAANDHRGRLARSSPKATCSGEMAAQTIEVGSPVPVDAQARHGQHRHLVRRH